MPRQTKAMEAAREEAIEKLREVFPAGSTVYTIFRHVSTSGLTRHVSVIAITDGEAQQFNLAVSLVLGHRIRHDFYSAVVMGGAGYDAGFQIAYDLGRVLHGDGYALKHRWL